MVLNNTEIKRRIATDGLLSRHDLAGVSNCAYILRAGKVFLPETGEEEVLNQVVGSRRQLLWQIGPSEVLVLRTKERVRMPLDLCATYAPLFRLSRQGVMLLNASLVEPGYSGRLSCFLVNFSSQTVTIREDGPIAKITFHTLNDPPATPFSDAQEDDGYDSGLSDSAKKFYKSFMDVAGIADRAAEKASKSARSAVVWGGIIIGVLLFWAQMEPFFSTWFKKAVGWPTNAIDRAEVTKDRQDLENKLKEVSLAATALQLQQEVQKLRIEFQDLKSRVTK